jgi:hypothetical protein
MIGLVLQYERIPATIIPLPTGSLFCNVPDPDEFRAFERSDVVGKAGSPQERSRRQQARCRHARLPTLSQWSNRMDAAQAPVPSMAIAGEPADARLEREEQVNAQRSETCHLDSTNAGTRVKPPCSSPFCGVCDARQTLAIGRRASAGAI